jgi:thymidylate kinase
MSKDKGLFVVVEGSNGAGKTTLINGLYRQGYTTLSSPNGTDLAKFLRPACRGVEPWAGIDKKIQFLLFSAARLDEYIRCVEATDDIVIADRWWTSTYVYQCVLQGISTQFMENTIHDNEQLDLVILLDGEDDVLLARMNSEREGNPDHKKCTWTQNEDTLRKLMSIYRKDLPIYLQSKGIECMVIDTTNRTQDEVLEVAYSKIEEMHNG